MNDSRAMTEGQKLGEMGNGKRTVIVLLALLVVASLIGIMAMGFRGRHIRRNAAALTAPVEHTVGPRVSPSAPPAPATN